MAKNKQDSKGDKAGKGAKGGKGGKKGADDSGETKSTGKLKGGQSINVRHILVRFFSFFPLLLLSYLSSTNEKEKERYTPRCIGPCSDVPPMQKV